MHTYRCMRRHLLWQLVYTVMEAGESHSSPFSSERIREVGNMVCASPKDLGNREADVKTQFEVKGQRTRRSGVKGQEMDVPALQEEWKE